MLLDWVMPKSRVELDEQMDLHGMNSKEAITNLQDFIEKVASMTTLFAAGFELEIVTGAKQALKH
jgi:DNA-nicking Smr family endonuclease